MKQLALATALILSTTAVAKPDLRVAGMTSSGDKSGISIKITLENAGDTTSPAFYIDAFQNPTTKPVSGMYGDEYAYIGPLKAGKSTSVLFDLDNPKPATAVVRELTLLLDTDGWVAESQELNNFITLLMPLEDVDWSAGFWVEWTPDFCPFFCFEPDDGPCVEKLIRNRIIGVELPDNGTIADHGWIEERWCPGDKLDQDGDN